MIYGNYRTDAGRVLVRDGGAPEGAAALIVHRLQQTGAEAQRRLRHTPP